MQLSEREGSIIDPAINLAAADPFHPDEKMLASILFSFFVALVERKPDREGIIGRETGKKTLLRGGIGRASLGDIRGDGFLHGLVLLLAPHELGLIDRGFRLSRGAAERAGEESNNDGETHRLNENKTSLVRRFVWLHGKQPNGLTV